MDLSGCVFRTFVSTGVLQLHCLLKRSRERRARTRTGDDGCAYSILSFNWSANSLFWFAQATTSSPHVTIHDSFIVHLRTVICSVFTESIDTAFGTCLFVQLITREHAKSYIQQYTSGVFQRTMINGSTPSTFVQLQLHMNPIDSSFLLNFLSYFIKDSHRILKKKKKTMSLY